MKFLVCLTILVGCASAKLVDPIIMSLPSILPVEVDVEKLVPPETPTLLPPSQAAKFDDTPIDGGRYCEKTNGKDECRDLQPGILVSEATYAQSISDRSSLKRLRIEATVLRDLRLKERPLIREAEKAYRQRIVEVETANSELRRPKWWEPVKFMAGFFVGAALATVTAYGAVHAVR